MDKYLVFYKTNTTIKIYNLDGYFSPLYAKINQVMPENKNL